MHDIKSFKDEELIMKMPLHSKVSVDIEWGDEKQRDVNLDDEYYTTEYYTETSVAYQKLVLFINDKNLTIHGNCPKCQKDTFFRVEQGVELNEEELSKDIRCYCDEQIDADDLYIPEVGESMDRRIKRLVIKCGFFDKHFQCPNCKKIYKVSFALEYNQEKQNLVLIKIGQYPPLSDIISDDKKMFNRILEKFDAKEDYHKAIRNNLNGDNIGAFVYLRRIIEKYVLNSFKKNQNKIGISEIEFSNKKIGEKISALNGIVPDFLIHNKEIYAIVSLGIHQLSEEECMEYYSCLKEAIDYVLSCELSKKLEKNLESEVQRIISIANSKK